jgi:hypothetical protein
LRLFVLFSLNKEYSFMPEPKKPYCGIVALSSVTGKPIPDLEYTVNMNRRRPKGSKIVGMQVKEVLTELTDSGFEYDLKDLGSKTRLTDYKTNGETHLLVLDRYKSDNPHMMVVNDDYFIDSDHLTKTHRAAYRESMRPVRAVIVLKKDKQAVNTLNEVKHE